MLKTKIVIDINNIYMNKYQYSMQFFMFKVFNILKAEYIVIVF
jgi:hypothetical protein